MVNTKEGKAMSVNSVSSTTPSYTAAQTAAVSADTTTSKTTDTASAKNNSQAAVYESSKDEDKNSTKKTYKKDTALVNQLKADAEYRQKQMEDLVHQMMSKQGMTYNNSTNIFQVLKSGKLKVSPEVSAQAKKDIAEDGYWGVDQTSERLVSFAKALSGGDPDKADKMIAAVKKGFSQATKSWGSKLPDICQRTLDATMKKMEEWKNSNKNSSAESDKETNQETPAPEK